MRRLELELVILFCLYFLLLSWFAFVSSDLLVISLGFIVSFAHRITFLLLFCFRTCIRIEILHWHLLLEYLGT
jgi:hypothetical protein